MDNNQNFETYLLINSKKVSISVFSETNKKVYDNELILDENKNSLDSEKFDLFLHQNIFKIEKLLKKFVKKSYIILDLDVFFTFDLSIKKKNYDNTVDAVNLNYLLNEAKYHCKETISDRKIIHMIIDNYFINNKYYPFLPIDIKGENYSIDLKFICLQNNFIKDLVKILKKYHISISKIVNAEYVRNFLKNDQKNIFLMTKKVIEGHNPNEVLLVEKTIKNQGFFEKFFNFFN